MAQRYDVLIIGAGSAGLAALREVRKRTDNFAIINDGPYGTTCARVGCMPSKAFIEAANTFHRRHDFAELGIGGADSLQLDPAAVLKRVRALRDRFVAGAVKATSNLAERSITGRARLLSPEAVEVNGATLKARSIILAPGSAPVVPAAWQSLGPRIVTTESLFEQKTLARRIAVVGMGAIGIELAQALSRLGCEVTGFSRRQWLAGLRDASVNSALLTLLAQEFAVYVGSPASVHDTALGIRVENAEHSVMVDQVLVATGRKPNIVGLGLESLGVTLDQHGLPAVDPATMQIGRLPVFFAGDVTGRREVLHEAADEGHIAGLNALLPEPSQFKRRIPLSVVFADPNVAVIGSSLQELDSATTVTGAFDFRYQARAKIAQENKGRIVLAAEQATGLLRGAELCAPAGEHLAHLLALAMDQNMTVHQLLHMPFYHPVVEEGLRSALRDLSRQLPSCGASDLAACGSFQIEALD